MRSSRCKHLAGLLSLPLTVAGTSRLNWCCLCDVSTTRWRSQTDVSHALPKTIELLRMRLRETSKPGLTEPTSILQWKSVASFRMSGS